MIIIGDDSEYIVFVKAHLSEQFLMLILVLFTTFFEFRVLLYLMASLFPKKLNQDLLTHVVELLLVMSALLRLL
jgi:hypothetical protein